METKKARSTHSVVVVVAAVWLAITIALMLPAVVGDLITFSIVFILDFAMMFEPTNSLNLRHFLYLFPSLHDALSVSCVLLRFS